MSTLGLRVTTYQLLTTYWHIYFYNVTWNLDLHYHFELPATKKNVIKTALLKVNYLPTLSITLNSNSQLPFELVTRISFIIYYLLYLSAQTHYEKGTSLLPDEIKIFNFAL